MGRWLTKSLFKELTNDPSLALFTLYQDDPVLPSLYKLYMAERDPSEYFFAKKHLGGWEHWERLSQTHFFKEYVSDWRKELDVAIRADALAEILRIANDPSHKSSYEANKVLLREKKDTSKRGRPSKLEVAKEASRMATEEDIVKRDAERLLAHEAKDERLLQ